MARCSSAYDCLQSITEGFLVFFSKQSELFEHKGFLYRGEDRLNCGRFYKPCLLPIAYRHFTKGRDGAYLAGNGQERSTISGLSALYSVELTTTAGRFFVVVWSVNGNGTRMTAPKL